MNAFRTRAVISTDHLQNNIHCIRDLLNPDTKLMAVLKGNAYGHGIEPCVSAIDHLTDAYGVATLEEAIRIRTAGSRKSILVFGKVAPEDLPLAVAHNITLNLYSLSLAEELTALAKSHNTVINCHIEIDTGLHRTGIPYTETETGCLDKIFSLYHSRYLRITGIYTHFSCSESRKEEDIEITRRQYRSFALLLRELRAGHISPGCAHCANSGAIIYYPEYQLDMVRLGMLIYGQFTPDLVRKKIGLKPALRWEASVVDIKHLEAGEGVSYDHTFITTRPTDIAIISAGYADGYKRSNSNRSNVIINGQLVPCIGTVCMDYLIADITDLVKRKNIEKAILLGESGRACIPVSDLAADTVNGDITVSISSRVPRCYEPENRWR